MKLLSISFLFIVCTFSLESEKFSNSESNLIQDGKQKEQTTISIKDYRKSQLPEFNADKHSEKDVEINRIKVDTTGALTDLYSITAYISKDGILKNLTDFYIDAKTDYDKARYEWKNDTTLDFTLFNSGNNLSERFLWTRNRKGSASLSRL